MRYRLAGLGCRLRFRNDQSAWVLWRARVANAHRNRFVDGRLNRLRMQDLRAEVSALRRLLVRQHWNRLRRRYHAGISGEHATDVSPDLNLPRLERCAD